tara:strand:- start:616 stop:771 length:156 start_codon:yes stop_codon:yes gene_type:complete
VFFWLALLSLQLDKLDSMKVASAHPLERKSIGLGLIGKPSPEADPLSAPVD